MLTCNYGSKRKRSQLNLWEANQRGEGHGCGNGCGNGWGIARLYYTIIIVVTLDLLGPQNRLLDVSSLLGVLHHCQPWLVWSGKSRLLFRIELV